MQQVRPACFLTKWAAMLFQSGFHFEILLIAVFQAASQCVGSDVPVRVAVLLGVRIGSYASDFSVFWVFAHTVATLETVPVCIVKDMTLFEVKVLLSCSQELDTCLACFGRVPSTKRLHSTDPSCIHLHTNTPLPAKHFCCIFLFWNIQQSLKWPHRYTNSPL